MKLRTHPHKSDLLTLTNEELVRLMAGETLSISSLDVRLGQTDKVSELCLSYREGAIDHVSLGKPNIGLVFDGDANELKRAEVLK